MKKKTNIRTAIRKIVREEVAMAIHEVITEMKQPSLSSLEAQGSETSPTPQQVVSKPKKKIVEKKNFSKNSVLNDILNETAQEEEWKTMGGGTYDSSRANEVLQSSYGDMMNNSSEPNIVVDGVSGDTPGMDFLKKDYRKLLKATEAKVKQKRG